MEAANKYRDGSVDLQSGVALTETGVTKFRFPRLAYAAEKTGSVIGNFVYRTRDMFDFNKLTKPCKAETVSPNTARHIGVVCLTAVSIVAVTQLPKIPEAIDLSNHMNNLADLLPDLDLRISRVR